MNQYERFGAAVDSLVALVEGRAHTLGPYHFSMSKTAYAMEFQTIAVNPGRRMGKSEYIRRNLRPGRDIWLVAGDRVIDRVFPDMKASTVVAAYVRRSRDASRIERVYVDEPSLTLLGISKVELYAALIARGAHTFILLGA